MNENQYRMAKVIIAFLLVIIAYLYVLNGRYSHIGDRYYFDKWTKTAIDTIDYLEQKD